MAVSKVLWRLVVLLLVVLYSATGLVMVCYGHVKYVPVALSILFFAMLLADLKFGEIGVARQVIKLSDQPIQFLLGVAFHFAMGAWLLAIAFDP
jgi:hypothetical protein